MPQSKRLNYYGFFGLSVALISIASYFVLLTRSCAEEDFSQLEDIEIIGTIVGTIVCVISFFNVAEKLYNRKCIFYLIVAVFVALGCLMHFGAFKSILKSCTIKMYYERNYELLKNSTRFQFDETQVDNWFQRKYGHNIVLFVFNFTSGILLWIIAYTFRRRL